MRKQFLLMLILCLTASMTWAERIDVATARKVAESVAQREGAASGLRSADELPLVYAAAPGQSGSALRSGTMEGSADYFVFNFPGGKGFAIVAGDDRVRPVLGYSDEGNFDPDNLPENLRGMLAFYQDQITWANDKGIETTPDIAAEWNRYMSGTALRAAGDPVLLNTARWSQGEPYNRQTPVINGQHAVTGCVATAMGIIMNFHKYPVQAVNPPAVNEYTVNESPASSQITYGAYDWGNMLDTYNGVSYNDAQANAVATLLWHCGANVYMGYTSGESDANTIRVAKALSGVFGYSPSIRYLTKEAYRWEEWKTMLKTELDAGYPVIYDGRTPRDAGHAFVCDGYNSEELYHINWGWNGSNNGFYVLSLLDDDGDGEGYSESQAMILNIRKEQTGEKYYMRPYLTSASYSKNGLSASVMFKLKYYALEDHGFYIDLGVVDQDNKIIVKPASSKVMNLEHYEGGWMTYTDVTRAMTLSSDLSAGQRIALLCSPDGTNWEVMHALEQVPTGIDNNGVINPTPDDPKDPEQPMNADIYWNEFNEGFLSVSGLDNNNYHSPNTKAISYSLTNVKENVIIRYTLKGYTDWADRLAVYTGEDYTLYEPNMGDKVTIDANGSFEITVLPSQIEYGGYVNYLKVLSDKAGELAFDIQVFSASDLNTPVFEQSSGKMRFVNELNVSFDKNPIRGGMNQEIPFAVKLTSVDATLAGKTLSLSLRIDGMTKDQVQLFDANGNVLELTTSGSTSILQLQNPVVVGTLTEGQSYPFKIKCNTAFSENNAPYIWAFPYVEGMDVPRSTYQSRIIIDPVAVQTYTVTLNSSDLKLVDGAQTVIESGKSFNSELICVKEGYRLPQSITVTMGGNTLVAGTGYTYDSTLGSINIPAVTGDVVITAAAELIPVITHTVSIGQLENLESDLTGDVSIKEGLPFTIKLTAKAGYLLPQSVNVKSGDTDLAAGTDYTYTPSADRKSGEIKINAVNSDLKIYAIAEREPNIFTITGKLTNLTATPDITKGVSVTENESYTFTLKAATDYRLPEAITVEPACEFTYDKQAGTVVIPSVTADLTITASATDDHHFAVVLQPGEGVVATPSVIEQQFLVNEQPTFNVKFAAAEGYTYDGAITVKMGETILVAGTDYTYDPATGAFALLKGITANLTIATAKAVKKQYTVTVTSTSLTPMEVPNTVVHGDPLSFKLVPDEGYNLPEAIEAKMGGMLLTAGEGYTYNKADGTVSIAKVTGNVEVTAVAVVKTYEVKLNLTNLSSDFVAGTKATHGEPLDIQLTATVGYVVPQTVTVLMNGVPDPNFLYENGKISISKVLGPIEITAVAKKTYTTHTNTENLDIEGLNGSIPEGSTIKAKLIVAEIVEGDYKLPYSIQVRMGDRLLVAGKDYTYNNQTGEIEIPNVRGIVSIVAAGIEEGYFEVVLNLKNLTSEPASFEPQAADTKIELALKPSSGYELPSGVTVKMGDATLAAGTDYAYDRSTGKFTLEKISGTLVITANGSRIPDPEPDPEPIPTTYTVTLPVVEGATISALGATTVTEGNNFSFSVEVKEGYNADNMVVKANGTTLTPDANGRYTIANIRSNVLVTVTGIVKGDDPTANEEIEAGALRVWASGNRLFIQTPEPEMAYIVTFDGRVYKTLSLSAGEYSERMPQGSYIIYIGKQSYKLRF